MYLNDTLRICLLSLSSRYPIHTVDFDNGVIAPPEIEVKGWTAQEMIEFLDSYEPRLLQAPAFLLVDECNCEIFLPTYSEDRPAIHIHCRGKIPVPRRHLADVRRKALANRQLVRS